MLNIYSWPNENPHTTPFYMQTTLRVRHSLSVEEAKRYNTQPEHDGNGSKQYKDENVVSAVDCQSTGKLDDDHRATASDKTTLIARRRLHARISDSKRSRQHAQHCKHSVLLCLYSLLRIIPTISRTFAELYDLVLIFSVIDYLRSAQSLLQILIYLISISKAII